MMDEYLRRRCRLSNQDLLDRTALPMRRQMQVLLNTLPRAYKVLVLRHPMRDARKELPPHVAVQLGVSGSER